MAIKLEALFRSPITGEICCAEHAPHRKTDCWWRDRWCRVTPRFRATWPVDELGEMRCEVCKSIERRATADANRHADPATGG